MAALSASGQNGVKVLTPEDGEGHNLMGLQISGNGQYVCGASFEQQSFLTDVKSGKFVFVDAVDGTELRGVSDGGVASGFIDDNPFTVDINGTQKTIGDQAGIAEAITPDGKWIVGSSDWDEQYSTHACIWTADGEKRSLPEPTAKWLGFQHYGTAAKYINEDASVICGWMIDNYASYPVIVWRQNEDGSYSADPISRNLFEPEFGDNPYLAIMATGISRNGKYIALTVNPNNSSKTFPARYNVETDEIELADEASIPEYGMYMSGGIAEDGTLVGYIDEGYSSRQAFIWKAGEKEPVKLSEAYPAATKFTEYDASMFHVASNITPDGKNILGFGINADGNMETYVFNVDEYASTGINNATTGNAGGSKPSKTAQYSIDGKKLPSMAKGINILRMSDGKSRKVMNR